MKWFKRKKPEFVSNEIQGLSEKLDVARELDTFAEDVIDVLGLRAAYPHPDFYLFGLPSIGRNFRNDITAAKAALKERTVVERNEAALERIRNAYKGTGEEDA